MDQCRNCLVRGDISECLSVPCHFHDGLWYTELLEWALTEVFDANYGLDYHDVGNGDGISKENAEKVVAIIKGIYNKNK